MKDPLYISIPDEAVPYILFQRTEYLKRDLFFRLLSLIGHYVPFLQKASTNMQTRLYTRRIKEAYAIDMWEEYKSIEQELPETLDSILDIGCGVAGIDAILSDRYAFRTNIYLLDKTAVDAQVYYGFKDRGSVYNSLALSKKLLEENGIPSNRIHLQEATLNNTIDFNTTFDLVTSFISWGYHYPVSTYLNAVYTQLRLGGMLILDIRNGTEGEKEIESMFGNIRTIAEGDSYKRILAIK